MGCACFRAVGAPWGQGDVATTSVNDLYSGMVGGLLFAARAALLACVGGLAFHVWVCLRWLPALVSDCLCMRSRHVSL